MEPACFTFCFRACFLPRDQSSLAFCLHIFLHHELPPPVPSLALRQGHKYAADGATSVRAEVCSLISPLARSLPSLFYCLFSSLLPTLPVSAFSPLSLLVPMSAPFFPVPLHCSFSASPRFFRSPHPLPLLPLLFVLASDASPVPAHPSSALSCSSSPPPPVISTVQMQSSLPSPEASMRSPALSGGAGRKKEAGRIVSG